MPLQQDSLELTTWREGVAPAQDKDGAPILILVYNGWEMVLTNLAVMSQDFRDIWIIDNASKEDMSEHIERLYPDVHYIRLDKNYGWAGGYNRALDMISRQGYAAAYILNSDAVVEAQSVQAAVAGLSSDARVAAVGSLIVEDEGTLVYFDGKFNERRLAKSPADATPGLRPVPAIHGAGFALSLSAYRDIGPFHEAYFLYHEEIDWCAQAKKKGYKILISGNSFCYHKGAASSSGENREYYFTRNTFLALRRGADLEGAPDTWQGLVVQGLQGPKGDKILAAARADGLIDGVLGRFGPRRPRRSPLLRKLLIGALRILTVPFRLVRKIKYSLRSRTA